MAIEVPVKIIPLDYQDSIYERGETFSYWVQTNDRTNSAVDMATCSETIEGVCGNILVNALAMTHSATGRYHYEYAIPNNANYGKYKITIESTTPTDTFIYTDEFFVLPWKMDKEVRMKTGLSETKDIKGIDLANICWQSYQEALRDVFIYHHNEAPSGNPTTGTLYDGSNTSFKLNDNLADINGDGSVTGWGQTSCLTDIDGCWYDENKIWQQLKITVTNRYSGEVTITQRDGTPIPQNNNGVYVKYYTEYESYNEYLFQQASCYLAAHNVVLRLKAADRVTIADLNTNKVLIEKDERRFINKYHDILEQIKEPSFRGVVI